MEQIQERKTFKIEDFTFTIFYNKVKEGEYGMEPMNCWCVEGSSKDGFVFPVEGIKNVTTPEEGYKRILPLLIRAVKRHKERSLAEAVMGV